MLNPKHWPEAALTLYRTFGMRAAAKRVRHELRRWSGGFRARPRHPVPSSSGAAFLMVDAAELAGSTNRSAALARAERVLLGEYQAFGHAWVPLPRDSQAWLTHPHTNRLADHTIPWWKVAHLDREFGDIKMVWEPARFGWVYDLIRAYLLTREDKYAAAFHSHLDAWLRSSPDYNGPHWSCGQEVAIRASALAFAEANFRDAPSSTAAAMRRLADVLAASGERIADAVDYAESQRNNHSVSEAAGLILLGARFQGVHPESWRWLDLGYRMLQRLIPEQFAADGWYIQHSFVYARLAVERCIIAEQALRSVGRSLPPRCVDRLQAAVGLLSLVMDAATGTVPNHGANDGSYTLPLTTAPYRDFRALLSSAHAMWGWALPRDIIIDREPLAWLRLKTPPRGDLIEDGSYTGASGWAVGRYRTTFVFLRAGTYTSRPGHIDPLHVTVRIGGSEVVTDAGTYLYNGSPPWNNGLAAASVHNGPVVDGEEPGIRGPRFLWYRWPQASILKCSVDADGCHLLAEIPGRVRRSVRITEMKVEVTDVVTAAGSHGITICWLVDPDADPSQVVAPDSRVVRASRNHPRGWYSPSYADLRPSACVIVEAQLRQGEAITTAFYGPTKLPRQQDFAAADLHSSGEYR